jgi:hypothetical protein
LVTVTARARCRTVSESVGHGRQTRRAGGPRGRQLAAPSRAVHRNWHRELKLHQQIKFLLLAIMIGYHGHSIINPFQTRRLISKVGVHIRHIEIMIAYCAYCAYYFAYFHIGHIKQ